MIAVLASRSTFLILVVVIICGAGRVLAECGQGGASARRQSSPVTKTYRHGRWHVAETANFQICCEDFDASGGLAERAEVLRTELGSKWFGDRSPQAWKPLCQVVLHRYRQSYVAAVGRGSEQTRGSSAVSYDGGRITCRRIDLLGGDREYLTNALPHELSHVIMRDHFASGTLPRWADEGMAMTADTDAKQARHIKDLQAAIASGTEYYAADLLSLREYPRSDRRQAFYGQSVFVAKLLIAQKGPQQFVNFLDRAASRGNDDALQECYGIPNAGHLDRLWRRELFTARLASIQ